ncbi:MAG TPA: DUF6263 family protein [Planctomycetota bacterium]|nr:DUF6263 family protein [Planctomycetota bacterium]
MSPFTKLQLLSLLILTTPLVCQGAEQDLKTVAKKGGSVWLLLEEKEEQIFDLGGQQVEVGKTTTRTLQIEVKDVDDKGNLVVDVKIARIQGAMTVPSMTGIEEVEFDSAKKTEGEEEEDTGGMGISPGAVTKAMTVLAGKSYVAKVDAFGKVASLEGVAELLKSSSQGLGGMGGGMMGAVTEAQLKQYVESAFGTLPDKPLAHGATWDRVDEKKGMGASLQTKLQLTLAKVDAESFEITATGTIATAAAKDGEKAAGAGEGADGEAAMREMVKNVKVKNGKISGTQRVSRQDGFVIESSSSTSMDVDRPGPMGGEMSISIKASQKTKRTTAEEAMPKPAPKPDKEAPKEAGK